MTPHPRLSSLLNLAPEERQRLGVEHTPAEIVSQPRLWRDTVRCVAARAPEVARYLAAHGLERGGAGRLVLAGAGTSAFAGQCLAAELRRALDADVEAVATTDLVTHPDAALVPGHPHTLLSIARSGNSPESLGALDAVRRLLPDAGHIILTCNPEGRLARGAEPERDLVLLMPPESNDQGLAMTASFSSMVVAGFLLARLGDLARYGEEVKAAARAAERIVQHHAGALAEVADLPFSRAAFLGSGPLHATARECALKLQELTNGCVMCLAESFLGLRHGPQAAVHGDTLVVAFLSSDAGVQRYERDMLAELREKSQGLHTVLVGECIPPAVEELADTVVDLNAGPGVQVGPLRVVTDVLVGQLLGLFRSLALGLRPDAPSPEGVINRVVEGVRIYDPDAA